MLIEELFSRGLMAMGTSKSEPTRQVGVFRPEAVAHLPAIRSAEMEKFRWIVGEWNYENHVPATRISPSYTDVGCCSFSLCEKGGWICIVEPDGCNIRHITYDPLSQQWIYLLTRGSYGLLRSPDGWIEDRIVFTGSMTMVGINCEWRMAWTKLHEDSFGFINEERLEDGSWAYIDSWCFTRK
jgi:hypothetical protein